MVKDYPDSMQLDVIGQKELDEPLHVLKVSSGIKGDSLDGKVHMALIGGLRGDEPIGGEILMRFIMHLAKGVINNKT